MKTIRLQRTHIFLFSAVLANLPAAYGNLELPGGAHVATKQDGTVVNQYFHFGEDIDNIPFESIKAVTWFYWAYLDPVIIIMTTDNPGGASAVFNLKISHYVSPITLGMRMPPLAGDMSSLGYNGRNYQVAMNSFEEFALQPIAKSIRMVYRETDPSKFAVYYDPFAVEFNANRSVENSRISGQPAGTLVNVGVAPVVAMSLRIVIETHEVNPLLKFVTMSDIPFTGQSGQTKKVSMSLQDGHPYGTARLQASADLGRSDPWTDIAVAGTDYNGAATFVDVVDVRPQAAGAPRMFFRVVSEDAEPPDN